MSSGIGRAYRYRNGFRVRDGDIERVTLSSRSLAAIPVTPWKHGADAGTGGLTRPVALVGENSQGSHARRAGRRNQHPSHTLVRAYATDVVAEAGRSRMRDYNETLTVQQLVDLVAFLHSRYKTVHPTAKARR